jgi:photosystem II stability/assembly factor-like uncharacterized protein
MQQNVRTAWCLLLAVCIGTAGVTVVQQRVPARAAGAASTWYWQNPLPRGYQLSSIACPSATSCVTAGFDGSIATTDDGGRHWMSRTTGTAVGLSNLSCPGPVVCYALGSQAQASGGSSQAVTYVLLQSMDGGATWQTASHFRMNSQQFVNAFDCLSPTTCIVGVWHYGRPQAPSILRAADGGKSWQSVHLAGLLGISALVCPTTVVCYAIGASSSGSPLLRSGDGGKTWSGNGLRAPKALWAIACPSEDTCFGTATTCTGCWGVFLTTDGARSWKQVAKNPAGHLPGDIACPSMATCYALATSGSNAYNTSVVGTANGGKTWSVHHLPDSASRLVCPGETACFLDAGFTLLATQDGFGHTHETLARSPIHNLTLTGVSCPSIATCYAAGLRHACAPNGGECDQVASPGAATSDGGRTWAKTPAPPALIARLSCPGEGVCYAIAGETGATQFVERSDDGARTWRQVLPAGGLSGILTDLSCPSATTCYVTDTVAGPGVQLAVLVTNDGGKTWTELRGVDALAPGKAETAGMEGRSLARVTCLSVTTCSVLAASFHQSTATVAMLLTSDGGKSWTRKSLPDMNAGDSPGLFTPPLACPSVSTCYLLLSNGSNLDPSSTGDVLVTHDGGASWMRTVVQAKAILTDMACPTTQDCWVAGWNGIFATTDGGATWQRETMADGTPVPQVSGIACPAAGSCYAVGGNFFTEVTIVATHIPGGTS